MNEKLQQILDKFKRGEQLTQDEAILLSQFNATVGTPLGYSNDNSNLNPLDVAYQKIKTGQATQEDISNFVEGNQAYMNQNGVYKYDPSIMPAKITAPNTPNPNPFLNPRGYNEARILAESVRNQNKPYTNQNTNQDINQGTNQTLNQQNGLPSEVPNMSWMNVWPATSTATVTTENPNQLSVEQKAPQPNFIIPTNDRMPTWEEKQKMEGKPANLQVDYKKQYPTENPDIQITQDYAKNPFLPYLFPGGSDISTELYSLGRAIGAPKGAPGRLATGIGAGGAALFDIARNVASGIGYEKAQKYADDWFKKKMQEVNYSPESQTKNTNTVGGGTQERGGTFYSNFFEEGGEAELTPEGHNEQEDSQETEQQQGQEQQPNVAQQIMGMVQQMLTQGMKPEQVVQLLVQKGVPQDQAMQIIQAVANQDMVTKDGKTFNAQPGHKVEFMHGGKKVSGIVKEVKNGKVILE